MQNENGFILELSVPEAAIGDILHVFNFINDLT